MADMGAVMTMTGIMRPTVTSGSSSVCSNVDDGGGSDSSKDFECTSSHRGVELDGPRRRVGNLGSGKALILGINNRL